MVGNFNIFLIIVLKRKTFLVVCVFIFQSVIFMSIINLNKYVHLLSLSNTQEFVKPVQESIYNIRFGRYVIAFVMLQCYF